VIRAMTTIPAPALEHVFDARILVAVPCDPRHHVPLALRLLRALDPEERDLADHPPVRPQDCPLVRGKP
jgi:hypothetical protein